MFRPAGAVPFPKRAASTGLIVSFLISGLRLPDHVRGHRGEAVGRLDGPSKAASLPDRANIRHGTVRQDFDSIPAFELTAPVSFAPVFRRERPVENVCDFLDFTPGDLRQMAP